MAFNREIWNKFKVSEKQPVGWFCGKCFGGNLYLIPEKVVHSKADRFSGIFKCTNTLCGHEYSCSGVYKYFSNEFQFEVAKEFYGKKFKEYHPLFFSESIRFLRLSPLISKQVERELDYSFGHFWNDYSACANSIRRSIEYLLDDLEVIERDNLHQRIEAYQKTNLEIGIKLMSIKWIGNAGSHKDRPTREDLLDAFDILDYCYERLFPDNERESRVNSISQSINQSKNIRSKNK
ncbi:MAG: DUF4145 domain-containing protein [Bacteroidetes bacterium]|nr:DUF4145 domain-containing protein [Bacteroidota bacterium]